MTMPDLEQIMVVCAVLMSLFSLLKWGFVDGRVDELRDEARELQKQLEDTQKQLEDTIRHLYWHLREHEEGGTK